MTPARLPAGGSARPARWPRRGRPVQRWCAERGDAPGWALVTAMTVALVLVVWAIAEEQIGMIVRDAFGRFQGV